MRRTIQIGLTTSILFGLSLSAFGGGVPAPPNLSCTGQVDYGSYTNIDVPAGATCTLGVGVSAYGNVTVRTGAVLVMQGTLVSGNLQADGARYVNLLGAASPSGPGYGPSIGGDLSYKKLTGPEPSIVCVLSSIYGNVDISDSNAGIAVGVAGADDPRCYATGNVSAQGDFKIAKTAGATTVKWTTIDGNADINENIGPVGLFNNIVAKTLDCKSNVQGVTGSGNQAQSKKDQCAGL